jgi:malonyl-ACP O-methyltransferase BioC
MKAVFDRNLLRMRRDRAAARISGYDFLLRDVADRLMERLDVVRKEFPLVLDLGGGHGVLSEKLKERAGTEQVITTDVSFEMLSCSAVIPAKAGIPEDPRLRGDDGVLKVVADEELLPFREQSLDAVISNLALHWVNDLPGALAQIRSALKPDGLFLAAVMGGETLRELRACLMEAELNVSGGASPRVSPFIDLRDMGALMQRAGFTLPVVDSDIITVDYPHPLKLMEDLRGMGASNATLDRLHKPTRRAVIFESARLYQEKYADEEGRIPATFQIVYAIGWSPHESQQKPLMPGSARHRLADALKTQEFPAGEKP